MVNYCLINFITVESNFDAIALQIRLYSLCALAILCYNSQGWSIWEGTEMFNLRQHQNKFSGGGRRVVYRSLFSIGALVLFALLSALPSFAQDRYPTIEERLAAPEKNQEYVKDVYTMPFWQTCFPHNGGQACLDFAESKCIVVSFDGSRWVKPRYHVMRISSGKGPVAVAQGFVKYPSKQWFSPMEFNDHYLPLIGGGITPRGKWPMGGDLVQFNMCGLAPGQNLKLMFRAQDVRADSPYKYGAKTETIKVRV